MVVLDDLSKGNAAAVLDAPLVVGRIQDAALVADTVRRHEVGSLVHFAALKSVGESVERPERYFDENVGGTAALLRAVLDAGVRHVVFSSTAAVYGTPQHTPIAEDHPLHPESPYGETKLLIEHMLPWFEGAHGTTSIILRYFNAAGAATDGRIGEDYRATTNLVPLVMKAVLGRHGPLPVFGTDYPTHAMAPVYATTCTSRTWPRPMCWPSSTSSRPGRRTCSTWAPAWVRRCSRCLRRPGASRAERYRRRWWLAGPATPLSWSPTMGGPPPYWAGSGSARTEDMASSAWSWHSTHPEGYPSA